MKKKLGNTTTTDIIYPENVDLVLKKFKEISEKSGYSFIIEVDKSAGKNIYLDIGYKIKKPKTIYITVVKKDKSNYKVFKEV